MIEYVPYEPKHFIDIAPRVKKIDFGGTIEETAKYHAKFPATTARVEEENIACFGITPLWSGVGVIWGLFAADAGKYGIEVLRASDAFIGSLMEDFRRVQCEVMANNKDAVKYIEAFGFEREGIMRNYGPNGENYYMYARVSS